MSRERPRRGTLPPVQENIDKLENVINEGNFYGAQQMYKSISARYVSAQRYSEALDLLHSGACLQLKHGQSCMQMYREVAPACLKFGLRGWLDTSPHGFYFKSGGKIYKAFPQLPVPSNMADCDDVQEITEAVGAAKTRVEGCTSFLRAAIKWSAESGAYKYGDPQLHTMLAEYIYSQCPELDMARVSFHFVRGNNPKKLASTLVNFMGKCYPGEDDIAIARAVLLYTSMGNLRDANFLLDEIKRQVASQNVDFPQSHLIQFITFLLLTLERDALPLFNTLRQNYKSSIDRDPTLNEFLDDTAEKFYGVQRRNPLQGMFGDLFKFRLLSDDMMNNKIATAQISRFAVRDLECRNRTWKTQQGKRSRRGNHNSADRLNESNQEAGDSQSVEMGVEGLNHINQDQEEADHQDNDSFEILNQTPPESKSENKCLRRSNRIAVDGKEWNARYFAYKTNNKYSRAMISNGWHVFVRDNELKLGDACLFELTDQFNQSTEYDITLNIVIYCANEDSNCSSSSGKEPTTRRGYEFALAKSRL
ncbi:hypothetical protein CCACVL1_18133 [Corchorus capsularis]|uniref:TF-B3 domain-containing protein n=1 Tax=Corchorus capsularis TaxID=210143 RepID=A0A1R3HMS4_COCAP|nr:hypothetical protein CCACVL1_18133 [Corchorus capsularis]